MKPKIARNKQIQKEKKEGKTYRELSIKYNLSISALQIIIKRKY